MRKQGIKPLCLGAAFVVLLSMLLPLFSSALLSGWDLIPHYYLQQLFIENLFNGKLHTFDLHWYAGYPAFALYPYGSYFYLSIPYLLSFGVLDLISSFNVATALAPFLLLISVFYVTRRLFEESTALWSLLPTLLFFLIEGQAGNLALGLSGLIHYGLVTNYIALPLLVLLLGAALEENRSKKTKLLYLAVLLAALFYTHLLTALFACWLLFCISLSRGLSGLARGSAVLILALLFASPWLSYFLLNLPYSSGETIGIRGVVSDPLIALFPGFEQELLAGARGKLPGLEDVPTISPSLRSVLFFKQLPVIGTLFLLSTIAGFVQLVRRKSLELPLLYLISLLLLPRDLLTTLFDTGVHFYRFIQPIFMLQIIIAAVGFDAVWGWLKECSPRALASTLRYSTLVLLVSSVLLSYFVQSSLSPFADSFRVAPEAERKRPPLFVRETRNYQDAETMMELISELKPTGRVAVETSLKDYSRLGSPHFFTSELPRRYDIPVVPGLLAESSFSSTFINAALRKGSYHMTWGRSAGLYYSDFRADSVGNMLRRLSLYDVTLLLTTSDEYSQRISDVPSTELLLQRGPYALYRIKDTFSRGKCVEIEPLLFVDWGGFNFREFSELYYQMPTLLEAPVIYTEASWGELAEKERDAIGGLIVSFPRGSKVASEELRRFGEKRIFLLNARCVGSCDNVIQFPILDSRKSFPELRAALEDYFFLPILSEPISVSESSDSLSFDASGGISLSYSFAPGWQGPQRVYQLAPSLMWVFAEGETQLNYD